MRKLGKEFRSFSRPDDVSGTNKFAERGIAGERRRRRDEIAVKSSPDLQSVQRGGAREYAGNPGAIVVDVARVAGSGDVSATAVAEADRKSTRLNSSHMSISYAVFCLKKKKKNKKY